MNGKFVCRFALACAAVAVPSSSAQACHWWRSCFGGAPTTTYYAPYTAAYAPAGCGQTVSYMPQTSYRTVYVNAPVVSYRPVAAADPCTGCATTVMRPVVSYVTQAQVVPYTTYRPVVMAARPCCGAAPVVASYAPAYAAVPAVPVTAAPAPCCGAAAAGSIVTSAPPGTPGAAVPSLAYPPASSSATTFQATPGQATTPTPSLYPPPSANPPTGTYAPNYPSNGAFQGSTVPAPGNAPPLGNPPQAAPETKTFQNPAEEKKPEPESRLLLPPRSEPTNSDGNRAMRGLDPESNQDRFTAIPLRPTYAVRPASLIVPAAEQPRDATWQAARR